MQNFAAPFSSFQFRLRFGCFRGNASVRSGCHVADTAVRSEKVWAEISVGKSSSKLIFIQTDSKNFCVKKNPRQGNTRKHQSCVSAFMCHQQSRRRPARLEATCCKLFLHHCARTALITTNLAVKSNYKQCVPHKYKLDNHLSLTP